MDESPTSWRSDGTPLVDLTRVLRPILDEATHEREEHDDWLCFRFPAADGADYRFSVYAYSDGQASFGATLLSHPDAYFWYTALELPDFPSPEVLAAKLLHLVSTSLRHRTRITQERGLLFHSFRAEAQVGGAWQSIGGGAAFRWGGFRFPPLDGRAMRYRSPALLS